MPQAWRYARVTYNPAAAEIVAAKLTGWAAMGAASPEQGPGLTQDETVQFVADLAVLRHFAACGRNRVKWAVYDAAGSFLRIEWSRDFAELGEGETALPVVGDEAPPPAGMARDYPAARDPTPTWPRDLTLAIDALLREIKGAEVAGSIPPGYGFEALPGGPGGEAIQSAWPIAAIAIVVGGAAVALIGKDAVWRYFDPTVRNHAASLRSAAKAYQMRLEVQEQTGVMPAASSIETSNAATVGELAKGQSRRYWGYGAAALAGLGGGAALLSYLRRDTAA
jgi:hypothetical protein